LERHVSYTEEIRNARKILVVRPQEKKLRNRWKNTIKMNVK
jgi:hypothetical protein